MDVVGHQIFLVWSLKLSSAHCFCRSSLQQIVELLKTIYSPIPSHLECGLSLCAIATICFRQLAKVVELAFRLVRGCFSACSWLGLVFSKVLHISLLGACAHQELYSLEAYGVHGTWVCGVATGGVCGTWGPQCFDRSSPSGVSGKRSMRCHMETHLYAGMVRVLSTELPDYELDPWKPLREAPTRIISKCKLSDIVIPQ